MEEGVLLKSLALSGRLQYPKDVRQHSFAMMAGNLYGVVTKWQPDWMLVGDDSTIRNLLEIQKRLNETGKSDGEQQQKIRKFLDANLLDFDCYTRIGQMEYIKKSGFPVPDYRQIDRNEDIAAAYEALGGTCYFKLSFESGGLGLAKFESREDIAPALKKIKVEAINPSHHFPAILQAETGGRELVVSFAAWKGKLLGYLVIDVIEKAYETGPSSVVKSVHRPEWRKPLEKLVKSMKFSGFGGLDVMEQDKGELPHVLEINARATHTLSQSRHLGMDLIARFYKALNGEKQKLDENNITAVSDKICAIFPQELYRDIRSPYITDGVFDVPWEDPPLMLSLMNQVGNLVPHYLKGYADILREHQESAEERKRVGTVK